MPSAIAIPWYDRASYGRLRRRMADGTALPRSFDGWLKRAKQVEQQHRACGFTPVSVHLDLDEWPAWCAAHGHQLDSAGRTAYATWPLAIQRDPGHGNRH